MRQANKVSPRISENSYFEKRPPSLISPFSYTVFHTEWIWHDYFLVFIRTHSPFEFSHLDYKSINNCHETDMRVCKFHMNISRSVFTWSCSLLGSFVASPWRAMRAPRPLSGISGLVTVSTVLCTVCVRIETNMSIENRLCYPWRQNLTKTKFGLVACVYYMWCQPEMKLIVMNKE